MPLFIFWIIFLLDLELNIIGKLLVFRWELIVLLLLQICFFFVMRVISWSLFHVKIRLTLLRLSLLGSGKGCGLWLWHSLDFSLTFFFQLNFKYLDDLLNIDNIYFDQMVDRIYPTELQLNRANSSDTEAPFLDLNLCISNGTVSTKIHDKRDDFDFDIVNFPFLDGDVPRRTSYGVYISQLIRFARASSNLNDFNYCNKAVTAKRLRQRYRYFKLRKAFSKFYRRHSALLEKYSVNLKTLLQQGISEPEFYGDLVYRFRKIVGKSNFSEQFRKLINRYKRIGYSLDIMRQTACLVANPIIVDGYASLFNCTTAVRASDSMTVSS